MPDDYDLEPVVGNPFTLQRTQPYPEAPQGYEFYAPSDQPTKEGTPTGDQTSDFLATEGVSPGVSAGVGKVIQGIGQWAATPGNVMSGPQQVEPEVPGQWSEEDQYRQNLADAEYIKKQTDFGGETALNLFGTSAPFVRPGMLGAAGGKLIAYKAMTGDEARIHPDTGMSHVALDEGVAKRFSQGRPVQQVEVQTAKPFDFRDPQDLDWLVAEMSKPENVAKFDQQTKQIMGKDYTHTADADYIRAGLEEGAYQSYEIPIVSDLIKSRGYDAVYMVEDYSGRNKPNLAVFSPDQIRVINREPAKPFYSAVERAIAEVPQAKASGEQWLATLRNRSGVKPEELEWLGLDDWLKEQKGPVTKQQIADYVRENQIEVKEVMKGEPSKDQIDFSVEHHLENEIDKFREQTERYPTEREIESMRDEIRANIHDYVDLEGSTIEGATKFSQWVLPGGENYREMLLTLPSKVAPQENAGLKITKSHKATNGDVWFNWSLPDGRSGQHIGPEGSTVDSVRHEVLTKLDAGAIQRIGQDFKSPHYEEPNILAHIRFNDRTIDGKKTLFVEEMQSDWHQKGKLEGYKTGTFTNAEREELSNLKNNISDIMHRTHSDPSLLRDEGMKRQYAEWETRRQELEASREAAAAGSVPDAPFKNWQELAMKRIIRYAAENGYEKVAWTPGEVQAARYDLSQHIKRADVHKDNHGNFDITLVPKEGGNNIVRSDIPPDKLADIIGKELADKIVNDVNFQKENWGVKNQKSGNWSPRFATREEAEKYHQSLPEETRKQASVLEMVPKHIVEYGGLDLKVGGEGKKKIYDEILPQIANKIGKKHGAKVGRSEMPAGGTPHGETETPKARPIAVVKHSRTNDYTIALEGPRGEGHLDETWGLFSSHADAERRLKELQKAWDSGRTSVHTLDITPSLRKSAMEQGFPRFAAGGRVVHSNIDHNPTEAQKKAGNYAKDHVRIHGLDITIENAKGKDRKGVGKNGKPWSVKMPAHYGYFKRTEGKDGDHVDCYIGDHPESRRVFIINQVDADKKTFDEHKCMLGFRSRREAEDTYKLGFSDGRGADRIGHITAIDIDGFKDWLKNGDTKRKFARGGAVGFQDGGDPEYDLEPIKDNPFVVKRTAPFPEKPEGYEFLGPADDVVPEGTLRGVPVAGEYIPPGEPPAKEFASAVTPSLQELQMGHVPDVPGVPPQFIQQDELGRLVDVRTPDWDPIPMTARPDVVPLVKDPETGLVRGAMPALLDVASNIGGGWAPAGGTILGAGVIARTKQLEQIAREDPRKAAGIDGYYNQLPIPKDNDVRTARALKREGTEGQAKNEAFEAAPGVWLGDVTFDQWLARTESILAPEEIAKARKWYQEALPLYQEYFGHDMAPQMMGAWLVANQNATPSFAQLSALRTREQLINSTFKNKRGGLPHDRLMNWWDAMLSGDQTKLEQLGSGQKIYDFIDSALGKNTRTFYGDDPRMGAPAVADVHSLRDMGFIDKAAINWLEQKFGKGAVKGLREDTIGGGPSETQYEWAANKMRRFTDELNARGYMGGGWTPAELQAVGWTSMSKMLGRAAETSEKAIQSHIHNVSYELDFGAGAPYNDQFGWHGINDPAVKEAVTKQVLPVILDEVEKITGAITAERIEGTGAWGPYLNPSFKSRLLASPEVVKDVANLVGYLAQQTEVMAYRPAKNGKGIGFGVWSPDLADTAVLTQFWNKIVEQHPDLAVGFSPSRHPQFGSGIEIVYKKQKLTKDEVKAGKKPLEVGKRLERRLEDELGPTVDRVASEMGLETKSGSFRTEDESVSHDWTKDPTGRKYTSGLTARYGPDLRGRLEHFKRQVLEPAIEQAIRQHTGRREAGAGPLPQELKAATPERAEGGPVKLDLDQFLKEQIVAGEPGQLRQRSQIDPPQLPAVRLDYLEGGKYEPFYKVTAPIISKQFKDGGRALATKHQANYRGGTKNKRCALCTMFVPPHGCTAVRGSISPHALCDYFKRKGS